MGIGQKIVGKLTNKFVLSLLVISIVFACTVSGVDNYGKYIKELQKVSGAIEEIAAPLLIDAKTSISTGDANTVNAFLQQFLLNSGTAYAAVLVDDKIAWEQGNKLSAKFLCSTFPLNEDSDLQHRSEVLQVIADIRPVYGGVIRQFAHDALVKFAEVILLVIFFTLLIQTLVRKRADHESCLPIAKCHGVETELLQTERKTLSQAIEQLPAMVIITDTERNITFVNHGVTHLSGFSKGELINRSIHIFEDNGADGRLEMDRIYMQVLSGDSWEGVIRTSVPNDKLLNLYSVVSPVLSDKKVNSVIFVCREISNELALQQEVLNAKKMEAVARLSASFAHEFGNPLFGVHSVLKDLKQSNELSSEKRDLVKVATQECERMAAVLREFQGQYRKTALNKSSVSVRSIVWEVVRELHSLMEAHKIECKVDLCEEADCTVFNRNRLALAVRNILVNAIESMQGRTGIIEIQSSLKQNWLILKISDMGAGIEQEHFELIFEPYFSTKEEMQDAGLGLSLAYASVKSLGGKISFTSGVSQGSVFSISLPRALPHSSIDQCRDGEIVMDCA